tara:strand:- start:1333 stop:3402 length:2070 start_codon:yes stop_codon:yes gene_type:complete
METEINSVEYDDPATLPKDSVKNENMYFAEREPEELTEILLKKAFTFYNKLESNDYLTTVRNMWRFYHGFFSGADHEVSFTGEQGELVDLPVNHFRNLASHMHNIITGNRPVMEARAINTDYKSLAQTHLANGILDYYMREKGLEEAINKSAEQAIVLGTGYVKQEWNATAGEAYDADPETGEINFEGEIEFSTPSLLDVIVDGTKETWDENNEWVMVRSFANKYNLAAKYPEQGDEIKALDTKSDDTMRSLTAFSNDETDDVAVYEFYHKKSEAVPEGRYLQFLSTDIVLIDAPMPYKRIPIYRIVPSEMLGTPYGYTPMFDVYPLQEAVNALYSSILTNQMAFAVQNVFVLRGSDITINSLEGGLNLIEGNSKPEPLNLTQTPQEVFTTLQNLIQEMETLTGINSVTRGNPEYSLKSGTAMALVQSMSLQFMSGLQRNYVRLIEDVGTGLIDILKDYASTPKLVALVGRNNRPLLKEFTGDQIANINRVIVDVGNPLSRTIAGRVQMAEQLAQMKLLRNPAQYFQVMNTGRLDATFEGEMSELLYIKQENEELLNGTLPQAVFLDRHSMHIQEHKAVMADPELRSNPELMENVAKHIQEHIELLRNTDPDVLQIIGEQPLNPQGMQGAGGLPPGPMQNQEDIQGSPNEAVMAASQAGPAMPETQGAMMPGMPGSPEGAPEVPMQPPM